MPTIEISVDGEPVRADFHIESDRLRMTELAFLEQQLGLVRFGETLTMQHGMLEYSRMVIYAQLVGPYGPVDELEYDDFDPSWNDLGGELVADDIEAPAEAVVLPMTLPDGTEVDGVSEVDPTRRAAGNE